VVVAMNDTEAKQLQQGQAEDLDVLEQILHSLEFSNISTHYTNDRNQWKPLLNSPNSIQDIVNDVIIKLNHSSHKQNPIQLHWCSEDFFSDSQDGAETRKLLNQTGCIVIVDAISMFHSTIRDFYNRSHVVGEATPIIVISPLTLLTRQINEKLEKHIYQRVMELPFSYCNGDYKLYYEFETDTNLRIKRWLYATIPSFIEKMSPNKADIMKKAYPLSQQMNKLGASRFSINMPNTTKVINV
jgi:hypothetical protein